MKETSEWAERAGKRILNALFKVGLEKSISCAQLDAHIKLANIIHEEMNNESKC